MLSSPSFLSLIPPLAAIGLAIGTRQVVPSLFLGIFFGHVLLASGRWAAALGETLESLVRVFQDGGNTKVILFSLLVGSLMALIRASGGVDAFVSWGTRRRWVRGEKSASLLAYVTGVLIFIESTITCLIAGTLARPFFDRFKIPREKLAYIIDSTSAPVCVLIPLNGWGALLIGLLAAQGADAPVGLLLRSLPFAFYPLATVILVPLVIHFGWKWGAMKRAVWKEAAPFATTPSPAGGTTENPGGIGALLIPVLVLVLAMPVFLYTTGGGNLLRGSGSTSVFRAVFLAVAAAAALYGFKRILSLQRIMSLLFEGMGELVPIVAILVLAFAMGDVCKALGTGTYVAGLVAGFALKGIVPALLFIASCLIAFSTGTSWGTFAIMVPIVWGIHAAAGLPLPLVLGAVLSGGIFGDHASPISDTTIVSSLAAGCDHIDHVNTQMPYALAAGGVSLLGYLLAGFILG